MGWILADIDDNDNRNWWDGLADINEAKNQQHPFHVLGSSRIPVFMGSFVGSLAITLIIKLQNVADASKFMLVGYGIMEPFFSVAGAFPNNDLPDSIIDTRLLQFLTLILLVMWSWARELIREAVIEGKHTEEVQFGLAVGMVLFLASEAMLFFPFFWSFFHVSVSPAITVGNIWPPEGISEDALDPFMLPMVNTIVLLTSGMALVVAHRTFFVNDYRSVMINSLFAAIMLGVLFSWLQFLEYGLTRYTITDGAFGSTFFMLTGLHGFHVIVGTCLLIITYWRVVNKLFSNEAFVFFECAAWYWHFVDVVWLFVFAFVYCWGIDLSISPTVLWLFS